MKKSVQTIGIVGGGQLGRMLTQSAHSLGYEVVVLDPGATCPAAQVGARHIQGGFYETQALEELARAADVVTFEIEHVDARTLEALEVAGANLQPGAATIKLIQDKFAQKQALVAAGVPVAEFADAPDEATATKLLASWGGAMILKTRFGAYDGRGNAVVRSPQELHAAIAQFAGQQLYAEKLVPFTKELAVMVAREIDGAMTLYPVVETVHERNICTQVIAPAHIDAHIAQSAAEAARRAVLGLAGAGVFGVELFLTAGGEVLVNEIAPRVHNSGHYTMNGCATSQFEQHIRAICRLPLGSTELNVPAVAMVNILGEGNHPTHLTGLNSALKVPGTYIHLYGKSPTKIDRKMGHINSIAQNTELALRHANQSRKELSI